MQEHSSLTNQLLIAMPNLEDPNFSRSVTYICEDNEDGVMGITINRPLELDLGDILDHMQITCTAPEIRARPVYMGGPIDLERGFVLHAPHGGWDSTLEVTDRIGLTTSKDILQALADGAGPQNVIVALGYSGWSREQMDREMAENSWLNVEATEEILFQQPIEQRWTTAAEELGIDINLLSGEAGHA
jgi:putative transcriptional regulator